MAFTQGVETHVQECPCAACAAASADQANEAYDPFATTYSAPTSDSGAGLISGRAWSDADLTYAFPHAAEAYDTDHSMDGI
ncbi:MAG: hypothetical protein AAFU55_15180, partial [Pseudomonadota bacterium]